MELILAVLRTTMLARQTEAEESERACPIVSQPGDGATVVSPAGGPVTFKARAEQTCGTLTAMESVAAPGEGPPLHVHLCEDELVYVVEGRLLIRLDNALHEAPAGSFVFIPRGVAHTWQSAGDGPTRFLFAFTPAAPGMERFFERSAELPDEIRRREAFPRFASDAGMEVLGAPLAAVATSTTATAGGPSAPGPPSGHAGSST
jgi:quercetin dioxygenase-like cupin family protein